MKFVGKCFVKEMGRYNKGGFVGVFLITHFVLVPLFSLQMPPALQFFPFPTPHLVFVETVIPYGIRAGVSRQKNDGAYIPTLRFKN